jgi:glycosyltransferase involved in cell wall biosynthesis
METKVSVIIPSYNSAQFLGTSIQSVLGQTFKNYEVIVVDDGSSDNCWEAVARFGDTVKYIRQENQGLAGARNTGIRAARGELIGLLDADDEWCPDYLEQMINLSEKYPFASVFYCMAQCMDVDGRNLPQNVGGPPVAPDLLYQKLLRANFIIPSTVTFRRKLIVDAGYFDSNLRSCEDWDLWLRILPTETIVGDSQSLVHYRVHGNSLSANVSGMHDAAKRVIEKHFGPDDGQVTSWSFEKRRAYGGIYRYYLLTSVQRQNNWRESSLYLRKALEMDPTLAGDLDMFYELALGSQPTGYRVTIEPFDLSQNALEIEKLLHQVFSKPVHQPSLQRLAYGTANFALGLIAYNINCRKLCRRFLLKALFFRPNLLFNYHVVGNLIKSFLSKSFMEKMKSFLSKLRSHNSIRKSTS